MKDSPDQDWFTRLSRRLGDYQEDPDDVVFNRIFASTGRQAEPRWLRRAHRAETVTFALLLMWSLTVFVEEPLSVNKRGVAHQEPASNEKSSVVDTDGATRNSQLKMELLPPPINHADPIGGFRQTRTHNNVQYPVIVVPHKTASLFSLSSIEVSISPITILATSPDSSEASKKNKIASDGGQKEAPIIPARKKRPIAFYGSLSPSFGFQKIIPFNNDGVSIESIYRKPVFSEDRFGLCAEGGFQWQVARRCEVYSGLSFFNQSQTLTYSYLSGQNEDVAQEEDFVYTVAPGSTTKRVDYSMLSVGAELGFMYHLKGDRLMHKAGAAISWQHGLGQSRAGESYNNAKSQYFLYEFFYRNEYAVNNRLNLFIQPFYKHVLVSKEVMDEPFEVRPYYAGLRFGVVYGVR